MWRDTFFKITYSNEACGHAAALHSGNKSLSQEKLDEFETSQSGYSS